jgi:hypothetical protein
LEKDVLNLERAIPRLEERVASIDSVFIFFKNNPKADLLPVNIQRHIKRVS